MLFLIHIIAYYLPVPNIAFHVFLNTESTVQWTYEVIQHVKCHLKGGLAICHLVPPGCFFLIHPLVPRHRFFGGFCGRLFAGTFFKTDIRQRNGALKRNLKIQIVKMNIITRRVDSAKMKSERSTLSVAVYWTGHYV